ncbi:uncharacterized protein LOC114870613 isoform X2 [Betta splendens]|uniref:Uncharacterized protein LOC114870613 isoform X2 n=1 Tax=Betta splendens TaxID=158456 RepID=A0A9W2XA02_BETSP|nr:uncharacterized protein LOC114870613 isoform X2 [Betta splendens]
MSESIVRKVQPFTIGTRLSVPSGPKCQEFTQSYLQNQGLDKCTLQHNLNSLYLSPSQVCGLAGQVAPMKRSQEHMAAEDQLNPNAAAAAASAVSRSIKKITISGSTDRSEDGVEVGPGRLLTPGSTSGNNNNNNNVTSASEPRLPRIVGVSCENKPKSHFKVLLRKDGGDEFHSSKGNTMVKLNGEKSVQQLLMPGLQKKDPLRTVSFPSVQNEAAGSAQTDCFTQRNSLFTKEALQAEAWIKGKLQDLKDGCNVQRCPLQDWEEASQTLHRDLKDFENTLIQLNQMGEQLICRQNPTSDLVKKQLSQLRDQWQTLKHTAANQTRALGGAKNLLEFNRKADRLEAWIKEKEEEQSLENVLAGNVDKMQLTRRILDLKQDEQLYRNLHEEINQLALKLEKQGRTDGRSVASRRKHVNKAWLKGQAHLKTRRENLQLALEVSSFYQQAENALSAMNNTGTTAAGEPGEVRDVAAQIMMLDVSVSQLSNLQPALAAGVARKHGEVKDRWALFRNERSTLAPTGSAFTREDADPLTPAREPQCREGTGTQRIMGKEVKEERNRLKGCVGAVTRGGPPSGQSRERRPGSGASGRAEEVTVGHRPAGGSQKPRAEPRPAAAPQGHPLLHAQLQKFTVSADKTLSWLKDNVSMATQVCSMASLEGLEAARRCQHALEQEILTNRARIEVVKREGRGLVRAQHPGSAKIEEFLSQLEVLWEELRRRHQRNAVFLQASGELGFRVVRVLQALGSLEAWLESVELSMKESALAGDPETMSAAERESSLLEKEVAARGPELGALRQEVDRLDSHAHPHIRGLATRMEELERKYRHVQGALTQQSSVLQDTRMLTEFLERVELEESEELSDGRHGLDQPLHSDISSAPSLLGLRSSSSSAEPLMESMGDPVEELREAVEMLNDTARERGRSQSRDQAIQDLLRDHARLAIRIEERLCRSKELSLDVLERETDMAVRCELDRCGLEALQETQDHLEIDYEVMEEELRETEKRASRLRDLCPERTRVLAKKLQATLQAWAELGAAVAQNRARLREFQQLRDFFRSYLAVISWTEDTRSCIFSEAALYFDKDGQKPLAAELDMQIEHKFEEFDELAVKGRNLLGEEHHLTQMVRERMEELRSMLGWILLHWRAQKQQWLDKKGRQGTPQDNLYSEAIMCSPSLESPDPEQEAYMSHQPLVIPNEDKVTVTGDARPASPPPRQTEEQEEGSLEDGYEVMNSIGPRSAGVPSPDSPKASVVVLNEPGGPASGGAVNLILSFGGKGDSQVQVVEPSAKTDEVVKDAAEPVHRPTVPQSSACKSLWRRCQGLLENTFGSLKRKKKLYRQSANEVSTYLHVKDNNLASAPVYESITLPRHKSRCASPCPPPPPHAAGGSIFSSLKRMGKKRKRRRDARRHTIQRIMGLDERAAGLPRFPGDTAAYDTRTWPLKEGGRKKRAQESPDGGDTEYLKNPLLRDIDTQCAEEYCITPYAVSSPSAQARSHCRFLSLGSVLSFDLPKDVALIPSIQDIITIAPPEAKNGAGADPDPHSQRHSALSSFKQVRAAPAAAAQSSADVTTGSTGPQMSTADKDDGPDVNTSLRQSPPPSLEEQEDHTVPCGGLYKAQFTLHEDRDKMSSEVKANTAEGHGTGQPPIYVNQAQSRAAHEHECPSVHTLIRDLNGHRYHKCTRSRLGPQCQNQTSHMVVNLKSTVSASVRQDSADAGISTSSSVKLCPEAPGPDAVMRLASLDADAADVPRPRAKPGTPTPPPPDSAELEAERVALNHKQFEEEEEELEDIWNQSSNYRQSVCSDIMYQTNPEEPVAPDRSRGPRSLSRSRSPSPRTPAVLYKNLVTASAPNLLVAEFRLPHYVQSRLGYDRGGGPRASVPPLARGDRRSWAAFPHTEAESKASVAVNETASDPVKLPDVGDSQRYIYQYREDEEEEEEEEVEEHTGGVKDQSTSLLSVHMGSERGKASRSPEDTETQEGPMAARGRRLSPSGRPELQPMEGTLERKHKLQLGGKKAASRAWASYYAVLHRHTLCFYQDRKDTPRGPACGLPLALIGAECSPAPEYAKKPNCFRLRLHDGSEYLLNASSRFMMKKWMMRIQANTCHGDRVCCTGAALASDEGLHTSSAPSLVPSCHSLARCRCSSRRDATATPPRHQPLAAAQSKEIVVLTRELSHVPQGRLRRLDEQWSISAPHGGCYDDDDDDDEAGTKQTGTPGGDASSPPLSGVKCRSHSFTSATYQRIRPVGQNPGGPEKGSNYCVTLVVGDKASDGGRSCGPPVLVPVRNYMSLPRPPNKSVFKKFFGKRDL